jgi:hypothetical protein
VREVSEREEGEGRREMRGERGERGEKGGEEVSLPSTSTVVVAQRPVRRKVRLPNQRQVLFSYHIRRVAHKKIKIEHATHHAVR